MSVDANSLLRAGLLDGLTIAVIAAPDSAGSAGAAVRDAATGLGAVAELVSVRAGGGAEDEEATTEAALAAALGRTGTLRALVVDAASLFAARDGGREALVGSLASVWNAARAVARIAFLPGDAGGRIVLIGPPPGAEHAAAATAGLENLARTLSIEWARYAITTVAVAPGADTTAGELAALACYLLSPAGAYFSGCLMDLRGVQRPAGPTGTGRDGGA